MLSRKTSHRSCSQRSHRRPRPSRYPFSTESNTQLSTSSSNSSTKPRAQQLGPVTITTQLDRTSVYAGGDRIVNMEVVFTTPDVIDQDAARPATDVVVVLDRSSSMNGEKIASSKQAIHALIDQLSTSDRFALVTYSSGAETIQPLQVATVDARKRWHQLVDSVVAGGGTNMSAGVEQALQLAKPGGEFRATRVVLLSDGHANNGDSSLAGLRQRAARVRQHDWSLSAIGVGEGFNEELMNNMANAGAGNYHYLANLDQLDAVLSTELGSLRAAVASQVALSIPRLNGLEVVDAAGLPITNVGKNQVIHVGSLIGGSERRLWVRLRVPSQYAETPFVLPALSVQGRVSNEPLVCQVSSPGQVTIESNRDVALNKIDPVLWERNVVQEDWNRLRSDVSSLMQKGKFKEADAQIQQYVDDNQATNDIVGSHAVADNLQEAEQLADQVAASQQLGFAAVNRSAKVMNLHAYQKRRHQQAVVPAAAPVDVTNTQNDTTESQAKHIEATQTEATK